jgi:hypothetical protein
LVAFYQIRALTTGGIGPSLRWGDDDFTYLHSPHINPNSLTDRARLVC